MPAREIKGDEAVSRANRIKELTKVHMGLGHVETEARRLACDAFDAEERAKSRAAREAKAPKVAAGERPVYIATGNGLSYFYIEGDDLESADHAILTAAIRPPRGYALRPIDRKEFEKVKLPSHAEWMERRAMNGCELRTLGTATPLDEAQERAAAAIPDSIGGPLLGCVPSADDEATEREAAQREFLRAVVKAQKDDLAARLSRPHKEAVDCSPYSDLAGELGIQLRILEAVQKLPPTRAADILATLARRVGLMTKPEVVA